MCGEALQGLGSGKSTRSRRVFSDVIAGRLKTERGLSDDQIVNVLTPIRAAILGESIKARQARKDKSTTEGADPLASLHTDQVIVLGEPEIAFLTTIAIELVRNDADATAKAVKAYFKDKETKANLKALAMGAGLDAAIFGRMVTSDVMARTDSAVHVAHSFTVHAEETEPDYFSALDDLVAAEGALGSGHINTSELTSGLFYAYVVIDLRQLVSNLSGDRALAAEVLQRLVHLIATVSPGAKRGGDGAVRLRRTDAGGGWCTAAAHTGERLHEPRAKAAGKGASGRRHRRLPGPLRHHVRRARAPAHCDHDRASA